jgi:RNA polymerase sigma-54 factor
LALGARLELRQGQGLVVTPQLQQAIKLLQLSNLELESFVETELERNPLLQRVDDPKAASAASASAPAPVENPVWRTGSTGLGGIEVDGPLAEHKSLHTHLHDQLAVARLDPAERVIAGALIDAVDDGGYLRADLGEIAERLGCDTDLVEKVLGVIQGFEPTGVAARSVSECLAIQLKERNRYDPAMGALLANLDLLARGDTAGLRKACAVDLDDLSEMIAELRALTPRPGAAFGGEPAAPVVPDVIVRETTAGQWHVELNNETLPRVLVNRRYHAWVDGATKSDEDRTFVAEKLAEANWLVKSLDQRARTILKVAGEIVKRQDGFLAHGVTHLRPLNLKTVAEAIGMHESTVSRVTSNKYMATPRGVFELKFFFTASLAAADGEGEAHSAESVRHRIRQLIEAERSAGDVHSDDAIVDILKEAGVDIARRTVAKYREAMRIPSSPERRRLLRHSA